MNIAFVLSYLADRFGGPVAVAKGLGRALGDAGHDVSYWATAMKRDRQDLMSVADAHLFETDWPHSWCRSRRLVEGLSAGIGSVDVMELSEFWLYPIYAGSRIAKKAGVPYILRPAGSLQSWALRRSCIKQIKKSLYRALVGDTIIRDAACVRAASLSEVQAIRRLGYRGPITVIPNGLDSAQFDGVDGGEAEVYWPGLKDRPIVLFMSRLSAEKGLDLLIPVWSEVVSASLYRDAMLVLAGPDYRGYQKAVQALIEGHGIQRSVMMPGMVQGRRKAALLRRADLFVLPSYSENFGIVVAEALACGTPVITTTGTPWDQLRQIDAGRWIPPEKAQLLDALREMLGMSASRRREMGRRGMQFVRDEYTWKKAASKFLHLCDCILHGKTIPLYPQPTG